MGVDGLARFPAAQEHKSPVLKPHPNRVPAISPGIGCPLTDSVIGYPRDGLTGNMAISTSDVCANTWYYRGGVSMVMRIPGIDSPQSLGPDLVRSKHPIRSERTRVGLVGPLAAFSRTGTAMGRLDL